MDLDSARLWLAEQKNEDGSWGYVSGNAGAGEPTLLAVASGQDAPLDWLRAVDLGWSNLTVPTCLSATERCDDLVDSARALIVSRRGEVVQAALDFDPTIPAWPWFEGTSPWVEPTAYAVLSLRHMGMHNHQRCLDGIRMLLDRQCDDGGWNYGNPAILGARLESDLATTGRVVLALPTSDATARALVRLRDTLDWQSTEHLSLAALAHVAHDEDPSLFLSALASRQQVDGSFTGRVDRTALAVMAFAAGESGQCTLFVRGSTP
jgi:hypothetical protein